MKVRNVFIDNLSKSARQIKPNQHWLNTIILIGVLIFRYRLGAIQKMMSDVNGTIDDEQLNHKNDLSKDILRRKAQLNQVS